MISQDDRPHLEAFINGSLSRASVLFSLQENDCAGLWQRLKGCGLQAPQLTEDERHEDVGQLSAALAPWLTASEVPADRAVVVAICDSWILVEWSERALLEDRLCIPGVLWCVTDVVNHWAHLPATRQRYPGLAAALLRAEVQVLPTVAGQLALLERKEQNDLHRPLLPSVEILAWCDAVVEAEPELKALRTDPVNREWIQFDTLEAHIQSYASDHHWVMLNADDLDWGGRYYSRVTSVRLSAWEAFSLKLPFVGECHE